MSAYDPFTSIWLNAQIKDGQYVGIIGEITKRLSLDGRTFIYFYHDGVTPGGKLLSRFNKNLVSGQVFISDRNIPLITQKTYDQPILTVENYEKWYSLFLIYPDGSVKAVKTKVINATMKKHEDAAWVDHCFHPILYKKLAEDNGWLIDPVVLEVITGRWVLEKDEKYENIGYLTGE